MGFYVMGCGVFFSGGGGVGMVGGGGGRYRLCVWDGVRNYIFVLLLAFG